MMSKSAREARSDPLSKRVASAAILRIHCWQHCPVSSIFWGKPLTDAGDV